MRELSLYILDIVQNSIAAQATLVEIIVEENLDKDYLRISIQDNGKGMKQEQIERALDPFYTSRTNRRVGLGLPMYQAHALECGGDFSLTSQVGLGTKVIASFQHSHIDRVPLGDIGATIVTIIAGNKNLHLRYKHVFDGQEFLFDTEEIRGNLDGVPLDNPLVLDWIKSYLEENFSKLQN